MSKLFFDHLVVLDDVEKRIKSLAESEEEKHELWHLVDEIVHHRVMGCVLHHLPGDHHNEFLEMFTVSPFDEGLIEYINEKTSDEIESYIETEMVGIKKEIMEMLVG